MKIKICGIRSENDIQLMNEYKPDFIGFIFFPKSPRYLTFKQASELKSKLNPEIKTVGVFVNEDIKDIINCFDQNIIDYAQLHGNEKQEEILELQNNKIPVIKAVKLETKNDLEETKKLKPDYFLFDIKDDVQVGGTGKTFNWDYLNSYSLKTPFFLAGGINSKNLEKALKTKAEVLDISSGVETDYKKDRKKVSELFELFKMKNGKI